MYSKPQIETWESILTKNLSCLLFNQNAVAAFAYKHQDRLSIIDPNNPSNDISGGSSNTRTILGLFSSSYQLLSERMADMCGAEEKRNMSLLEVLYAGNYSSFRLQRTHLLKLSQTGLSTDGRPTDDAPVQW